MGITYDPAKIKIVDINEVRPNTWNPKEKQTEEYKNVVKSIKTLGLREPIIVREKDGFEILDGEQRFTACQELNYDKVIIYNEGPMNDKEAMEMTIWYQQQVPFKDIKVADLISDLVKFGDPNTPYSAEKIQEFLQMKEFDFDQYNDKEPEFEEDVKTISIKLSASQYQIVRQAIDLIVRSENVSEARAIELICADYLSGASIKEDPERSEAVNDEIQS